jgi:hypothetical protein
MIGSNYRGFAAIIHGRQQPLKVYRHYEWKTTPLEDL